MWLFKLENAPLFDLKLKMHLCLIRIELICSSLFQLMLLPTACSQHHQLQVLNGYYPSSSSSSINRLLPYPGPQLVEGGNLAQDLLLKLQQIFETYFLINPFFTKGSKNMFTLTQDLLRHVCLMYQFLSKRSKKHFVLDKSTEIFFISDSQNGFCAVTSILSLVSVDFLSKIALSSKLSLVDQILSQI